MDNFRPSLLPVIGSGLLLFVLNNIAANINLPHHLRLTLLYPSATIINFTIPFHNENITTTKYERPSTLVIELQRLSMGARI
jgi:hypothetical protein